MASLYVVVRVALDIESQDVTMQPVGAGTYNESEANERARLENEAVAHLPADGEQLEFKVVACPLPPVEPDWRGMVEGARAILERDTDHNSDTLSDLYRALDWTGR